MIATTAPAVVTIDGVDFAGVSVETFMIAEIADSAAELNAAILDGDKAAAAEALDLLAAATASALAIGVTQDAIDAAMEL